MSWLGTYVIVVALVTPVAAAIGVYRSRRLTYVVFLMQAVIFLEVGAILYLVNPPRDPANVVLLEAAVALVALDIAVIGWVLVQRRRLLTGTVSVAQLRRVNDRAAINRALTVLAIAVLLLGLEPWIGVACLLVNAAWLAAWLPARMRTYQLHAAAEIAADPAVVFDYLIDSKRWAEYRRPSANGRLVSVRPEGQLAPGSEITVDISVPIGRALKPYVLRSTSVVTAVAAGTSYSMVVRDRPSEGATTRLERHGTGTTLLFDLQGVEPYVSSALGVMLEFPRQLAKRRKDLMETWGRLDMLLRRNTGASV